MYDIYNGVLPPHKKEQNNLKIWMNLESVIDSEVSQKEKSRYTILMHKYAIQKNNAVEHLQCRNRGAGIREQRVLMKTESGELGSQIVLREGPSMGEEQVICQQQVDTEGTGRKLQLELND